MDRRYAMVPGDGIGIDVTKEAVKVLEAASSVFGSAFGRRILIISLICCFSTK